MSTASSKFDVSFDDSNQELVISGSMRPQNTDELDPLMRDLRAALPRVSGTLYINVKRLIRLNNIAFHALANALDTICRERSDLKISLITSSVLGWSTRKFRVIEDAIPNVVVEEYDNTFYPGQTFVENSEFINVLRTQTKLTWRHERNILPRHGMREGLAIADICCGIGDFAALTYKEFKPSRLVALDHSRPSLGYARKMASQFGLHGIEYIYGDAAEMLLEDDQFDLVTCRHSLQIFNQPELILSELVRICKPGGRVYATNEKNSHCLGEPHGDAIRWTYEELARLMQHFNMDIEFGPKSRRYFMDAGLEDIRLETFMVTNIDDPQGFADVVNAWKNVAVNEMSPKRGDPPEFSERLGKGFDDHIFAALHPKGYAGWPVWVASGRKPQ